MSAVPVWDRDSVAALSHPSTGGLFRRSTVFYNVLPYMPYKLASGAVYQSRYYHCYNIYKHLYLAVEQNLAIT